MYLYPLSVDFLSFLTATRKTEASVVASIAAHIKAILLHRTLKLIVAVKMKLSAK